MRRFAKNLASKRAAGLTLETEGANAIMADTMPAELTEDAVHLAIDIQNIFARGGIWETPWMERVLPTIVGITARYTARTVFTRFITPLHADDRPGRWRRWRGD